MLQTSSVLHPSRTGRRLWLWANASALALAAAALTPHTALAANFTAGTEQQLRDAIAAAAASPDPQSTITLTAGFAVATPITLPNKTINLDPAGFTITGLTVNGTSGYFVVNGGGVLPLVGSNKAAGLSVIGAGEVRLESGAKVTTSGLLLVNGGGALVVDGVGSVLTANSLEAANGGAATIRIRNGGVVHALTTAAIGLAPNNTLDLTVSGVGSKLIFDQNASLGTAASSSNAAWTISDHGAATVAGGLVIGSQTTSQPTAPRLTVTGAGSTLGTGGLTLYRGEVSVLDGGEATVSTLSIGPRLNNGTAKLLVSDAGSRLVASGAVTLGASPGAGIAILANGGVLKADSSFTAGTATAVGVLNFGGGEGLGSQSPGVLETQTVTLGAAGRLNFNHTDANYEFKPAITGAGAIKVAAGTTHLTGDSSGFAGTTTIAGGKLHVDGKLGGAIAVGTATTLGGSGTIGGDVTVNGGTIAPGNSPGTLSIAGNLTLDGTSVLDMEFGESNTVGGPMNDLIKVAGDLRLDGVVNATITAGGVFDAGLYRIISYGGTLDNQTLAVGTTPPGSTVTVQTVIPGQVNLVNTAGLAVNFWDGDGAGSAGNGRVDGGAGTWTAASTNWTTGTGAVNNIYSASDFLIFAGTPGTVNVGTVTVGGGMQFAADGYRLAGGTITLSGAGRTFRVGDGTADGKTYVAIIDSPITGPGAGIIKTDLGTLILNGANTYGFTTTVQAGTLLFNGTVAGGGSALIVSANGTVGGTGATRGGVVNGTLAPGGLALPGTLTFNGPLILGASSTLRYRLGQAGTVGGALNDLSVVNGNLTLNGTLTVAQSPGGSFGAGVYRLIDYTGSLTDNVLDVGSLPGGFTGTVQTSIAKQVNLVVAAIPGGPGPGGGTTPPPPPRVFSFWDGAGSAGDHAITGGNGTWRADAANWTTADGDANGTYDKPMAIFAGTGGAVSVDGSAGAIVVGGLQFAADGYRLSGDGVALEAAPGAIRVGDGTTAGAAFTATIGSVLSGAGGVDKTDAGTLILTAENTYAGGTRVSRGVLQLGDGGRSGSVQGDVRIDGVLAFHRADDVVFAGVLTGAGALAQIGPGATILTADSGAFTGLTEVRAGALAVDGALGGLVTVFGGGRLTGTGKVGSLSNQAGGVVAPGHGDIGVLTVTGDYAGAGGVLELDARLGATPAADRLVVRGAASGETLVKLNRLAGDAGLLSPDGLVLVQVDGASNGAFALATGDYRLNGEAVLVNGAYGYVLRKDADGDWRLRSGEGAKAPIFQPGVPVYEAYGRTLMLLNRVDTLRQRASGRERAETTGLWGRIEGGRAKLDPAFSTAGAGLKADRWRMEFGLDRTLGEDLAGGRLSGGLTAHYGEVSAKIASPHGGGEIRTKGYGLGANLTWAGGAGGYIDVQAQASWFDSDLASRQLGRRADGAKGDGHVVSLEVGKALASGGGLRFTPQAQLSYAKADFDGFADTFGAAVSNDRGGSLIGRVGLAVDHDWSSGGTAYLVANVRHEFMDGLRADVSGVRLENRLESTWGDLAAGGAYSWGHGRFAVYGQATAATSLSSFGDSYEVGGSAGFRMSF